MQTCMKKYQNEFTIKFAQLMQERLAIWKEVQKHEQKSLYSWGSITTYFIVGLLGFIPGKREYNYDLEFHCWAFVVLFIIVIIGNIQTTNKTYQKAIKMTLFPELLTVFGGNIHYAKSPTNFTNSITKKIQNIQEIAKTIADKADMSYFSTKAKCYISDSVFQNCGLYDKTITQREDDDIFSGKYNDVKFVMNETDFGWNARDKYRTYHSMFKGLAMRFTLNKEIKSRVLIVSKFSWTKIPKNYEKVELESSEFAKKFNVYVDNSEEGQVEARYLLNTAFINRFMQIRTSFRVNKMCCSVFGKDMLIMLSTKRDLFEMNHLFGKIDDINQYKHLFDEFASVLSFIEVLNLSSKTKL